MRVLIDECLNWRICRALVGHHCTSAQRMGWAGLANGDLLKKAEKNFDVLITGDRNLSFQQDTLNFNIAVIVLHAKTTKLDDTLALIDKVLTILKTITKGDVVDVYP
ncbi:MAG TPA: DUF5615 family PIN-like protein [Pyrinomonadaceae bacterium]|nr:DUF5615 family PIN-like protein [Pyrinomonadaceae bacterium]